MKAYIKFSGAVIILLLAILTGCGTEQSAQTEKEDGTLSVYTTIYPLQFFAEQIGGSHVDVQSIMSAGTDAHTYEPSSKTIIDIAEADAFIYNSEELETYAGKINEVVAEESVQTLEASNGVVLHEHSDDHEEESHEHEEEAVEEHHTEEEESTDGHEHSHGEVDPHVWLDPVAAVTLAENIKEMLVELKPEAEQEFEENFKNLEAELVALDEAFHEEIEAQPRKEILVTHAAYGYWEKAYGIEQIAISGISTADEPSQKQIEQVIESVKEHQINYLLTEQNVTPKFASVIQNETGIETQSIHNLETLTEEDINNQEDYFTLMNKNLEALRTALEE